MTAGFGSTRVGDGTADSDDESTRGTELTAPLTPGGTASPSFGSRELSYLPFPGEMVSERTNMALVYVSMEEKTLWDIRQFLRERMAGQGD